MTATTSIVNINDVLKFVGNKSFDDIRASLPESLRVKDSDNLYLIVKSDYNDIPESDLEKQANGIIFEKETNKVMCMAQPCITDINDPSFIEQSIQSDSCSIEACEDGTMIRLYNYNGCWYTATTRCIDGSLSRWSSDKSFDEMFWEIFNKDDLEHLDTNCTYIFVLLHSENTIVVHHQKNQLVFISRINNTTFEEVTSMEQSMLPFNKLIRPCVIIDNVKDVVREQNTNIRGIIVRKLENGSWVSYKYDFPFYIEMKQIRGNTPNIRQRVLELLKDPVSLGRFEQHYPEYSLLIALARHSLVEIAKTIHKLYIISHIKHLVQINEENIYYRTLKQLHAQYKNTNKPITYDDVLIKVSNLDSHVLKGFMGWV